MPTSAVVKVGSTTRTNSSGANTTYSATLPQTPTRGNILLAACAFRRTGSDPAFTGLTGWVEIDRTTTSAGVGDHGLLVVLARVATGTEGNPSVAFTATTSSTIIEERSGLGSIFDDSGVANTAAATSGSTTLTASHTTDNADDWTWGVGATTNLAATTFTWGGGQTADFAYAVSGNIGLGTSTQLLSTAGAKSPSLSYNRTSGTGMMIAVSIRVIAESLGILSM